MNNFTKIFRKYTPLLIFLTTIVIVPLSSNAAEVAWDFGEVSIGSSSKATVTIGLDAPVFYADADLLLKTIKFVPGGSEDFKLITSLPIDGTGIPLASDRIVTVEVEYSPSIIGSAKSSIEMYTNDPFVFGKVNFSGTGVNTNLTMKDVIQFFDESAYAGTLQGVSKNNSGKKESIQLYSAKNSNTGGKNASNHLHALRNMMSSANSKLNAAKITEACEQLNVIYQKIDGHSPPFSPPDFIEGIAKQELADRISSIIEQSGCGG